MRRSARRVALLVIAPVIACSSSVSVESAGVPEALGPGKWGSPEAELEVTVESATIRFEFCADGTLKTPIRLAPDGRFDVPGTYVRNIGPSIAAKSARYVGLWRPASLTLTVILSDSLGPNDSDVVGPFDLVPNQPGPSIGPCPI